MPNRRITMRQLTDILRLKYEARLSHAKIAAALGLSKGVVSKYVSLAEAKGVAAWPPPEGMDEAALERLLFARTPARRRHAEPDFSCRSTADGSLDSMAFPAAAACVFGTIRARSGLAGANTPWYLVRCARGLGTSAASRAIKSARRPIWTTAGRACNSYRLSRRFSHFLQNSRDYLTSPA